MEVIAKLNRELGKTIFLVTHDMEFVTKYADRVLVLSEGTLLEDGSPRQVFSQPDLLRKARIRMPQVCEVAFELQKFGHTFPEIPITLDEAEIAIRSIK